MMAVDCMAELSEAGFAIGSEILVAGFDDIPLARYVTPQLTTVHSDITRLGAAAAEPQQPSPPCLRGRSGHRPARAR